MIVSNNECHVAESKVAKLTSKCLKPLRTNSAKIFLRLRKYVAAIVVDANWPQLKLVVTSFMHVSVFGYCI